MTKQYDIIPLNNHLYMVDKDVRAKAGWNWNYGLKRPENLSRNYEDFSSEWQFCRQILASTDNTLGLPLLPKVEEEGFEEILIKQFLAAGDTQWVNKEKEENPTFIVNKLWLKNFYKLAIVSIKKYTEEDMIDFARLCREDDEKRNFNYKPLLQTTELLDLWKSLTPKPKKIWVVLENDVPLVDEKGYIKVEKWEF